MNWLLKNQTDGWLTEIRNLDLERRVRYATNPPDNMAEHQVRALREILVDCMEECKKQDELRLMKEIEAYLNKNDTEGWLTILRYFDLEHRSGFAKKPAKQIEKKHLAAWSAILVTCLEEYMSRGMDEQAEL